MVPRTSSTTRRSIFYGSQGSFVTLGDYDTFDSALRITNASLALPTGTASVTFGGDFRYARLANYVDKLTYGDGSLVEPPDTWVGRSLQRVSGFGELQAPLLPASWLPKWITGVETDLAARYTASDLANEANLAPTGAMKVDFRRRPLAPRDLRDLEPVPAPNLQQRPAAQHDEPGRRGSGDARR